MKIYIPHASTQSKVQGPNLLPFRTENKSQRHLVKTASFPTLDSKVALLRPLRMPTSMVLDVLGPWIIEQLVYLDTRGKINAAAWA
jgi:hypothetical protein